MTDFWKKAERDVVTHDDKMNVVESCVDRHARATPDKTAFVFDDNGKQIELSYAKLEDETCRFANLLGKLNVKKRSRIFIFLPKVPELYVAFLGTIKHGSIAAPLFEAFQKDGLMLRLERGDADVLVTNKELYARVPKDVKRKIKSLKHILIVDSADYKRRIRKCPAACETTMLEKNDAAVMIFTSSTAGTPVAGVLIPHYGLVQQHATARLVLGLTERDRYWCTAHPAWVTGSIYGIIAPLSVGCTNYVFEEHFDARKWLGFITKNKISVVYTAPTALKMLKHDARKRDFANVRNVCSVGEALPRSIFDFYKRLGIEINDTYWQSETGAMVIANYPGIRKKPGSLGKALPGIAARVRRGMIVLKPKWPAMMTGIYKHEKMYKSYFENGWFKTNDVATVDKDGYFFFVGRRDDIIKTSGERVSPLEIENVLHGCREVKDAAVIGVPDEEKGQIIKAFVVLAKGVRPTDELKLKLELFVKKNYAGHAYPKDIEFVERLPKTHSGKIIRMELKTLAERAHVRKN